MLLFQHTAARRRLLIVVAFFPLANVSTHSRPKAADMLANELHHVGLFQHTAARRRLGLQTALILYAVGFNTQPPEGGWTNEPLYSDRLFLFQHTAARRRLVTPTDSMSKNCCFNTQPPEGGCFGDFFCIHHARVSTHSRPKAAGVALRMAQSM